MTETVEDSLIEEDHQDRELEERSTAPSQGGG